MKERPLKKHEIIAKNISGLKEMHKAGLGYSVPSLITRFNLYKRYREFRGAFPDDDNKEIVGRLMQEFGYTQNTIYTYLRELKEKVV